MLLLLLLLCGAVVNVAVAWGWAAWGVPPHDDLGQWSVGREESPFWLMRGHGGMGASVVRVAPIFVTGRQTTPMLHLARGRPDVPEHVKQRFAQAPASQDEYVRHGFDERGWPLRCLRSEHSYRWVAGEKFVGDVTVRGGIHLWPEQTARGGWALQRVRALPLVPIWPAFLLDTLLYAALTAVIGIGYPAMVRTLGWRRSARLAVVALLAAPIAVVAVAGAIAARHQGVELARINAVETLPQDAPAKALAMARQDRFGGTRLVFSSSSTGTDHDRMPRPPVDGAAPAWSRSVVESARRREWQGFDWLTVEAVGWPCRALESSFHSRLTNAMEVDIHRGILLDRRPTGLEVGAPLKLRLLPTKVLWRGFLADWALYAFVLFGVIACPVALMRAWRFSRGRCAECGYDLRCDSSARCPECGWVRRAPHSLRAQFQESTP